jgi:hypothetical protein
LGQGQNLNEVPNYSEKSNYYFQKIVQLTMEPLYLSVVGIPFHIATFSLFEFQEYAVARGYFKSAHLPTEKVTREEWHERREFHR